MKKTLALFLISISLYGAVPAPDSAAPEPNYGNMMPMTDEQDPNKSMVGDDDLNQELIEYGIGYEANVGKAYIKKVKDESGRIYYIDIRTETEIQNFTEQDLSPEYKDSISGIEGGQPIDADKRTEKNNAIKEAKEKRKAELINKEYTPKKYENLFLHNLEASGRGSSIVNNLYLNPENLEDEIESKETQMYMDNFSYSQTNNTVKTFKSQENSAKLAEGYKMLEDFQAQLTAKYSDKSIQCYISRDLIPKYFCPMIGREGTEFAGDLKTSSGNAQQKCRENCRDSKTCITYNVLANTNIDLGTTVSKNLYPSFDSNNNFIKTKKIEEIMMVDTMTFDIEVTPSEEWKGTPEEFEKFLSEKKIKFRYSLIKKEETLNNPSELLIDAEIIEIKSSKTTKKLNISNTTEYLTLLFYKPYVYENKGDAEIKEPDIFKMIGSINIERLKGEYKSKDLHFCPFRQLVNTSAECDTEAGGQMITLRSGSQVLNICTDQTHKIGPDRKYGGFYTKETCELNCVEEKDCLPTYRHYSDFNTDDIFKASVGCVESETNTGCTQAKCEQLLADNSLLPTNEWVTYNDDYKKQTIYNKVIDKSIIRPKFNLGDELATAPEYNEMFQSEMKDSAYKYMIDNGTFNRISYRIGEESPRKMSYLSQYEGAKQKMLWNLKPASFDIDNNENYNLYVVIELDQLYQPVAGTFIVDGQRLQADRDATNGLQFLDKTYMIKSNVSTDSWKVFKKTEFTNIKRTYDVKTCVGSSTTSSTGGTTATSGGTASTGGTTPPPPTTPTGGTTTTPPDNITTEWNEVGYYDNKIVPDNCTISLKVIWPETPFLNIKRTAFYDSTTDSFLTYDENTEIAEKFFTQKFSSDTFINTYNISDYLQLDLELAPGGLIRSQESLDHDMRFRKIYNVNYAGTKLRGWPYNYKIYAFYSKENLTYKKLEDYLIQENAIYEKANPHKYATNIKHDGDINNNIKPFILGNPNKTTVNTEIYPYLQEEGQKVFKFMFLYDDADGTRPFEGYQIQGN
jgi:hypothetical protein